MRRREVKSYDDHISYLTNVKLNTQYLLFTSWAALRTGLIGLFRHARYDVE